MGSAAYVGRVGGLAVALGIGSAVFAGHGVAWADSTDSSPAKATTSATSATSDTNDAPAKADKPARVAKPKKKDADAESEASTPKKKRSSKRAEASTETATTTDTTDPAVPPKKPKKVAVFANASKLAAATPATVSPQTTAPPSTPKPARPILWALMSFARREVENLSTARSTASTARSSVVAPTSLAATDQATAAAVVPYVPFKTQVSPSTNFVSWVTGSYVYGDKTLANTLNRFSVYGTDVGVMWDNGIPDDPKTPLINEHQVLIAVGDTFGAKGMTGRWISNTLFRSSDTDLSDGISIPNGEWFNGNMFGGAPLSNPTEARPIINRPSWLPNSVTLIPTAGVSLPSPITKDAPFGATQYVSFMSVSKWGSAGRWTTNYSAIAYSTDNGENFTVAPQSVRYNSGFSGNRNFQQSAFVDGNDGYVYVYGTPNGRQGAAYLARVSEDNILNVSQYEYYKAAKTGWFGSSPASWVKGNPSSATAIIGKSGGLRGASKPGYTVSEMSVQYNEYLQKYIVLYGDQNNSIVMRTSDTPEGLWSDANVLMTQQTGGIYAPMMHPWSPSTEGTGSDLYWNLSLWSEYNVMLMHTDLTLI